MSALPIGGEGGDTPRRGVPAENEAVPGGGASGVREETEPESFGSRERGQEECGELWFEGKRTEPGRVEPDRVEPDRAKSLEGKRTEPGRVWKQVVHGSWFEFVVWWCVGS